jgi:hypothetical protein
MAKATNHGKHAVPEDLPENDDDVLGVRAGAMADGMDDEEDEEQEDDDQESDAPEDEEESYPAPDESGPAGGDDFFAQRLGRNPFGDPHPEDPRIAKDLSTTPMAVCEIKGAAVWFVEKKNEYSGLREPLGKAPLSITLPTFIRRFLPSMPKRGEETVEFCLTAQDAAGRFVGKRPYAMYPIPWDNNTLRTIRGDDIAEQSAGGSLSMDNPLVRILTSNIENERMERRAERQRAEASQLAAERARAEAIDLKISHATAMQGDLVTAYGGVQKSQQDSFAGLLSMQQQMSKEERERQSDRERREQEEARMRMELDRDAKKLELEARIKEAELKAQVEAERIKAEVERSREDKAREEKRREEEREQRRLDERAADERRREERDKEERRRADEVRVMEERKKEEREEQRRYEDRVREDQRKHEAQLREDQSKAEERAREEQRRSEERAREEREKEREERRRADEVARELREREWKERLAAEEKAREDRRREDERIREERRTAEERAREERKREDDMRMRERDREKEERRMEIERQEKAAAAERERDRDFRASMEKIREEALNRQQALLKEDAERQREHTKMMLSLVESRNGGGGSGNKLGVIGEVLDTLGMTPGDLMEKAKEFLSGDAKSIGVTVVEQIGTIAAKVLEMSSKAGEEVEEEEEEGEEEDDAADNDAADAEADAEDAEDRERVRQARIKRRQAAAEAAKAAKAAEVAKAADVAKKKEQKRLAEKLDPNILGAGNVTEAEAELVPVSGDSESVEAAIVLTTAPAQVIDLQELRVARSTVEMLVEKVAGAAPERWPGLVMEVPDPGPFINYVRRVGADEAFADHDVNLDALCLALAPLFGGETPRKGL